MWQDPSSIASPVSAPALDAQMAQSRPQPQPAIFISGSSVVPVISGIHPPHIDPIWDDSGYFVTLDQRLGGEPTDLEKLEFCDKHYLRQGPVDVAPVTEDGEFAIERDEHNDRGDEASIQKRADSIAKVGLLKDLGFGPFLRMYPRHMNIHNKFKSMHFATRCEGLKRCWLADTKKENRVVQLSIQGKLKNCKIYAAEMPVDAIKFMIHYGNIMNDEVTSVTPLQVWRYTAQVEPAFIKQKSLMCWNLTDLGPKVMDQKKLDFANSMYDKWPKYCHYENCNTFYKEAPKVTFTHPLTQKETNVWEDLEKKVMAKANLPALRDSTKYDKFFMLAGDCLRVFRTGYPHLVADIILMSFPTIEPLGQCSLLPDGLPNPCFQKPPTQEDLKELLMSMKGSETFAELGRATIRKQELKNKKVAAAAQKAASSPAKTPVKKGQKRPLGEPGSPQKRTKISYQVTSAVDDEGCKVSVNFKKCFL